MTITLNLSPEQEQRLRSGTAKQDAQVIREVLIQAVDSTVQGLLRSSVRQTRANEFAALLDKIAAGFQNAPVLSNEALSREGIYADHP